MESRCVPASGPRLSRDRMHAAVVLNQLATPGMGSWIAGRRRAGAGQLVLSVAGFLLFCAHFGLLIWSSIRALTEAVEPAALPATLWKSGLLLFGVAWAWSGITSFQLWRDSRAANSPLPPILIPPSQDS